MTITMSLEEYDRLLKYKEAFDNGQVAVVYDSGCHVYMNVVTHDEAIEELSSFLHSKEQELDKIKNLPWYKDGTIPIVFYIALVMAIILLFLYFVTSKIAGV